MGAVLVAISIPIFNSQLEKSRDAVTVANIRAAYAQASTDVLTGSSTSKTEYSSTQEVVSKGTHQELLKDCSLYRNMTETQEQVSKWQLKEEEV